ncbi:BMP family ABC transporter substrate-binding protein [Mycoplasmopsis glycophila]|uniref:ABC transporter substrate-binding protein PnrA-like domain-containing protein n=1 Tax=Mycoplasmopsis glycophila TaxID=171285 RepID=A0A449AUG6_9BACT|nr:BMP family ABC transporter substrate-binding protein [Mycoplasmopsis glycophila]VEU70147.1 Uncharacterised protein [Mycoplasmopsis glycophila]
MKKIRNIILGLSTVVVGVAPLAIAMKCSEDKKQQKELKILSSLEKNDSLTSDVQVTRKPKMILITDEGHVTDKSFNQSSWEALQVIKQQIGDKGETNYIEPSQEGYDGAYNAARTQGWNIWILSGFKHENPIKKYLANATNRKALEDAKVKIICVDFAIDKTVYNYAYSLQFKVSEPGWIVGYATGAYLNDLFPNNPEKRIASSFGGGPFNGVTDFNRGFVKGLLAWNVANPDKKVKTNKTGVPLDSGFIPNDAMKNVIINVLSEKPNVVLPVAGPATNTTVEMFIKDKTYSDATVIGVDVDQAYSYQEGSKQFKRFLTSITKNIAQAVYDVILASEFNIDSKNLFADTPTKTTKGWTNGLAEKWAGYTKSHIANDELRTKYDTHLAEALSKFQALSAEEKTKVNTDTLPDGTAGTPQDLLNAYATKINE